MNAPAGGSAPAAAPAAVPSNAPAAPVQGGESKGQEWSDADEREIFSRLSRAPFAKVKADGKEKAITSKEDFLAVIADAARGRGANRLVEQTKKEREETMRMRSEAERILSTLERARQGDEEAIATLGILRPEEREAQRQKLESMDPEIRRVWEENQKLKEERRKELSEKQRQVEEEKLRQLDKQKAETLEKARTHAKELLKDVREELHDVELPEVIGAMRSLLSAGQRIGVDYDASHLAAFVAQRRQAALDERFGTLKPEAQLKLAMPALKQLVSSPEGVKMLEELLGQDFDAIATPISERRLARWRGQRQKAASEGVKPASPAAASPAVPKWMVK